MITGWAQPLAIVLLLFNANGSYANDIYIKQVGDNTNLTIDQDGQDNTISHLHNSTAKATLHGNNQDNSYTQTGDNNSIGLYQSAGNGQQTISQTGDRNIAVADSHGNNAKIILTQTGNDNTVYAELGNGGDYDQTITVSQDGDDNEAYVEVNGNDNTITIDQDGNNHSTSGINSTPITGDRNTLIVTQNGSQYEQFEGMLIGDDNTIDVYQGGSGESNFLKGKVVGNNNSVTSWQGKKIDGTTDLTEGGDHEAYITVTGDNNTYHSAQTDESTFCCSNKNHLADIVTGNSNTVVHDQRGNGAHMGFIEVTGDSNDVDVLQRGGQGDHFYDLVLDGNSNSVTSIQKGNGAHSTTLDLTNNGGEYTVNTTQDSVNNQSYSMTGSCTNMAGCSVSILQN
jgi:hypothetical protein